MKNLIKTINVCLIALLSFNSASGMKTKKDDISSDSTHCLFLSVKFLEKNARVGKVKITLYKYNSIVYSLDGTSEYNSFLEKDQYYTLQIEKEGYEVKRISISTFLPTLDSGLSYPLFEFSCDVEMTKKIKSDEYFLDFPIALISFQPEEGTFMYNQTYHRHIHEMIAQLRN